MLWLLRGEAHGFWLRYPLSIVGLLASVISACIVAELAGYWLHRLLHSGKLSFLSRSHMIHHMVLYGPQQPMRRKTYRDATASRLALGNIGLEWLIPSVVILIFCWSLMILLRVPSAYQCISLCTLSLWPIFTFNYLHDRMHLHHFWMARTPFIKRWFLTARRFHDIHHHSVDDSGRMNANFGIGFYFFDRVFHTLSRRHRPFNWTGYQVAKRRYAFTPGAVVADAANPASSTVEVPRLDG